MADSDGDAVLVEKSGTKSLIWKHFGLLSDQEGKGMQPENPVCRICHNRVRAKTGNTSNLLSHLRNKHARHYRELRAQMEERAVKPQSLSQPTLASVVVRSQLYDRSGRRWIQLTDAITNWIAEDGLPLYSVEKSGFKKLIAVFDPRYEIPSRNYFSRTGIPALYASTRDKVAQEIQAAKYFSATTDMWSSVGMKPYISFTVHFLDSNWKLQSRCLQTAFMPEDHTADNIVVALTDVLDAWQLNSSRLVAITTDSGSNIVSACKKLDWVRLSCFGHNLHLAIKKATNDSRCTRAIAVCKKIVSAFSMSWKKRRDLTLAQIDLKLEKKCLVGVSEILQL